MEESIRSVLDAVIARARPQKVILFSRKNAPSGDVTSFKLCVILSKDAPDKAAVEREVYLRSDSDVPFDLLFYTADEWAQNMEQSESFAANIARFGKVLYE
jgi:hypothetical protein